MRLFTAIQLPEEILKHVWHVSEQLQKKATGQKITWVKRDALHVTFQFLGELSEDQAESVKQVYKNQVQNFRAIEFKLKELSGFPNKNMPRVINVAVEQSDKRLAELWDRLTHDLLVQGIRVEHTHTLWLPHITLGRVHTHHFPLPNIHVKELGWRVESIDLIESHLGAGGPKYKELASFQLASGG